MDPFFRTDWRQHSKKSVMTSIHFSMRVSPRASDAEIWAAAQQESRFLITQDLDFSDVRKFSPVPTRGYFLPRLRNPSRTNLVTRVLEIFREEGRFGGLLRRCYRTQDSGSEA